MEIGITEPLRKFLKWKPLPATEGGDPLFSWDANRIIFDGRSCLVLCNAANRMIGVRAMAAADWKHLDIVCEEVIEHTLKSTGFPIDQIAPYICASGPFTYSKTHGRRALGGMNRAAAEICWCKQASRETQFQFHVSPWSNATICHCATRDDYGFPSEWMLEDLVSHGFLPENPADLPVFEHGRLLSGDAR